MSAISATGTAWSDLSGAFAGQGLHTPPIPQSMRGRMRVVTQWCWSTRPIDPMAMYRFTTPRDLLLFPRPEGELAAVCHAGHGLDSYAMSLFLIYRELALFAQVPWGGVHTDRQRAAAGVNTLMNHTLDLVEIAESRRPAGSAWRLICLSDVSGSHQWAGWARFPPEGAAATEMIGTERGSAGDPLVLAADLLRAGPPQEAR